MVVCMHVRSLMFLYSDIDCRFLVVANALAAGYSLIQGLCCVLRIIRGSVLFSKPLAWIIFSADQVPYVYISSFYILVVEFAIDQRYGLLSLYKVVTRQQCLIHFAC